MADIPSQFNFEQMLSYMFPGFFAALSVFMILDILSPFHLAQFVSSDINTLIIFYGILLLVGTILGVIIDGIHHRFIERYFEFLEENAAAVAEAAAAAVAKQKAEAAAVATATADWKTAADQMKEAVANATAAKKKEGAAVAEAAEAADAAVAKKKMETTYVATAAARWRAAADLATAASAAASFLKQNEVIASKKDAINAYLDAIPKLMKEAVDAAVTADTVAKQKEKEADAAATAADDAYAAIAERKQERAVANEKVNAKRKNERDAAAIADDVAATAASKLAEIPQPIRLSDIVKFYTENFGCAACFHNEDHNSCKLKDSCKFKDPKINTTTKVYFLFEADKLDKYIALREYLTKSIYYYSEFFSNIFIAFIPFTIVTPIYLVKRFHVDSSAAILAGFVLAFLAIICLDSAWRSYQRWIDALYFAFCKCLKSETPQTPPGTQSSTADSQTNNM